MKGPSGRTLGLQTLAHSGCSMTPLPVLKTAVERLVEITAASSASAVVDLIKRASLFGVAVQTPLGFEANHFCAVR